MTFTPDQILALIRQGVQQGFLDLLQQPGVTDILWKTTNRAAPAATKDKWLAGNLREEHFRLATAQSVEFIEETILSDKHGNANPLFGKDFPDSQSLMKEALARTKINGLYMEFGVFSGRSINFIAQETRKQIHGFDSFAGISHNNGIWEKGTFSTKGNLPEVRKNVTLHPGWFEDSLPEFLKTHPEPAAFIHIDCDIYQGAKTVLDTLAEQNRIQPGTVIQFDEFFNYPGWKIGEYKAFKEFIQRFNITYSFIGYAENACQLAVQIRKVG